MWATTDEDRQNARGGVNSPAARAAQDEWAERAARRREQARKRAEKAARAEAREGERRGS